MNLQDEKNELAKMLLETEDNSLIKEIKALFKSRIVKDQFLLMEDSVAYESTGVARVIIKKNKAGKLSKKTSEFYNDKEAILSLKLNRIETNKTIYNFNTPVLFQLYQEGKGTILENQQLDLYASGLTTTEAKLSLFEQFDHTYKRLNDLKDNQLSDFLLKVRQYYNIIIKSVTKQKMII